MDDRGLGLPVYIGCGSLYPEEVKYFISKSRWLGMEGRIAPSGASAGQIMSNANPVRGSAGDKVRGEAEQAVINTMSCYSIAMHGISALP
ncbi:MAG TPA: hypothetical protein VE134_03530, partial [Methanomicrobiales archaeon]|nr:hypothetical protein [Methanomicrobiales archaeon]